MRCAEAFERRRQRQRIGLRQVFSGQQEQLRFARSRAREGLRRRLPQYGVCFRIELGHQERLLCGSQPGSERGQRGYAGLVGRGRIIGNPGELRIQPGYRAGANQIQRPKPHILTARIEQSA